MKKLLLILMVMITIFMTGCIGQNTNTATSIEARSYDLTFINRSYINFDTGAYYSSNGITRTYYDSYATTIRQRMATDTLDVSSFDFNYIFFWDEDNHYIGYQRTASGVHTESAKYLGVTASPIVPPVGAKKFSLMAKTFLGYINENDDSYLANIYNPNYDIVMPSSNLDFKTFFEDTEIVDYTSDLMPFNQDDYTEGYSLSITDNVITIDGFVPIGTNINLYNVDGSYIIGSANLNYLSGSMIQNGIEVGNVISGIAVADGFNNVESIIDNDYFSTGFNLQVVNYLVSDDTYYDNYRFELELWDFSTGLINVLTEYFWYTGSHDYDFSAIFSGNTVTLNGEPDSTFDLTLVDTGYNGTFYIEYLPPETGGSQPDYIVSPKIYDNDTSAYVGLNTGQKIGDYGDIILTIDGISVFDNDTWEVNVYSYYALTTIDTPVYEGLSLRDIFEQGRTIPALDNLVTNGDFSDGLMGWTSYNTKSVDLINGKYRFVASGTGGVGVGVPVNMILDNIYYIRVNDFSQSVEQDFIRFRAYNPNISYDTLYSIPTTNNAKTLVIKSLGNHTELRMVHFVTNTSENQWFELSSLQLFNLTASHGVTATSGTAYDNAVADIELALAVNNGYIDEWGIGDKPFTVRPSQLQLDEWLDMYLAAGNDFNSAILIPYYFENYNYTLSEAEFEYWQQLYYDYEDTVDRYEWYSYMGLENETEFNFYRYEFDIWDLPTAAFYSLATFEDVTIDYIVSVNVPATIDENIESGFDSFGLGDFGRFLILFVIIGAISLLLGIIHVPYSMILLVDILLFMTSFLLEWIPAWLGIITVIVLFITLITVVIRRN